MRTVLGVVAAICTLWPAVVPGQNPPAPLRLETGEFARGEAAHGLWFLARKGRAVPDFGGD